MSKEIYVLNKDIQLPQGVDVSSISDGYHTFKELYMFRMVYNALLFNEWAKKDMYNVHKSKRHNDGELCFGGGWFIVSAMLPTGLISNHYEMKYWDLFDVLETSRAIFEFDGHTSEIALERMIKLLKSKNEE